MKFIVKDNPQEVAVLAADLLEAIVREEPACVLGLATGSSPVGMYRELSRRCKEEGLDFSQVTSVNLDEYIGLDAQHDQSYHYFMRDNFLGHINIDLKHTHVPHGDAKDPQAEARRYEELLQSLPAPAVQVLGIGTNGHVGFNEPADCFTLSTHVTELTEETIQANARFFESASDVPRSAITMGMGSILRAKRILLIALGESKQAAVKALEDDLVDPRVPATLLKLHPDVTILCDGEAGKLLSPDSLS